MPLTTKEIEIFRITELCYCYIWKYPLQWDLPKYTKPQLVKSLPHTIAMIIVSMFGISAGCTASCINWLEIETDEMSVICMACVFGVLLLISFICFIFTRHKMVRFLHNLMEITTKMRSGKLLYCHVNQLHKLIKRLCNFRSPSDG